MKTYKVLLETMTAEEIVKRFPKLAPYNVTSAWYAVQLLINMDYDLVGVCYVGGCKSSGHREWHFVQKD